AVPLSFLANPTAKPTHRISDKLLNTLFHDADIILNTDYNQDISKNRYAPIVFELDNTLHIPNNKHATGHIAICSMKALLIFCIFFSSLNITIFLPLSFIY